MYKLRLGRSLSAALPNFEERLKEVKQVGFDTIDFDVCGFRKLGDHEDDLIASALELLPTVKEVGLALNAIHIPFGRQWDISTLDEMVRLEAIRKIAAIFAKADASMPVCYVIHGSYEPIPIENRTDRLLQLKKSLLELCSLTQTPLAIEILPRTCLLNTAKEAVEMIDSLPEQVKVCVDVNHFLQETAEDGVKALGKRIITTHISDHDYLDEKHWMPMQGKIDWKLLLKAFEEIGYHGVFNYEVSQDCTPAEIKENYDTLFSDN